MFDSNAYDELIDKLKNFTAMGEGKQRKFLKKLMLDEEFIGWMYYPKAGTPNVTPKMVTDLYDLLTRPKVLHALYDMMDDYGYSKFGRSQAALLYTLATMATDANNARTEHLIRKKNSGDISSSDAKVTEAKLDAYNKDIEMLLKCARRIVKRDAKTLSKVTRLDKSVCIDAYWNVPAPEFIDKYRVGRYSNILMEMIYDDCAAGIISDPSNVRWHAFFKEIFGKNNVEEVADWVLMEGVHRIDKYKGEEYRRVRDCWDVLTNWALKELNDATEDKRDQMIELYIKRIDKMFRNSSLDLRVNLLNLDKAFPQLAKTVDKYADKISAILEKSKASNQKAKVDPIPIKNEDDEDDD